MKRFTLGILAHVDSGKTTLSEAMLYISGAIRKLGRVDHKNAFLDNFSIEQDRGITVFSKQAMIDLDNTEITLLDTPGHVDFSIEAERTLQVLDYAVLVISGSEGIQSHSQTLWNLLSKYKIPTFIFVNKMDLPGYGRSVLMKAMKLKFSDSCVDFSDTGSQEFFEEAAMCDEKLTDKFLSGENLSCNDMAEAIFNRKMFPCFFGSALKTEGVKELLDGLAEYTKNMYENTDFGARVFKIGTDEHGQRLTYLKITGGSLEPKTLLSYAGTEEKVNLIRIYSGQKYKDVKTALAGQVCAVTGLSKTYPGMGLGRETDTQGLVTELILTYKASFGREYDVHTVLKNLKELEEQEPQFAVLWNEETKEINVRFMGEVQIEVIKTLLSERYGMNIDFTQGKILYKETIAAPVEGMGHFEPLRHYAEVRLLLEPMPRGSGISFESACSKDALATNWQRLILTHLEEKTHIGVLIGSPITDIKISLAGGRAHQKHTEGGDFRQATYRAVRHGLMCADSILLEPYYSFRLTLPQENVGRALNDITLMGGKPDAPDTEGDMSVITGEAPVSKMRDYQLEVTAYTHGKGKLFCTFKGYEPCHNTQEVIENIGYDPESDLRNSPDSVFCAGGAGFTVKWYETEQYMHTESIFAPPKEVREERVKAYVKAVADNDELMRIFEQTYGPVKRVLPQDRVIIRGSMKESEKDKEYKAKPVPSEPEYLLIDGYNIIFAWDKLNELSKQNIDLARETLVNMMCDYQAIIGCELIIVFDAYKVKGNPGSVEKVHNINIVYTKEAETADSYIEKVTHKLSKKHRVRVATSDSLEQLIILGNGALRISARAFLKEYESVRAEIREYLNREI